MLRGQETGALQQGGEGGGLVMVAKHSSRPRLRAMVTVLKASASPSALTSALRAAPSGGPTPIKPSSQERHR